MLSRTAQSLYWMGRYIERADAAARLIEMGRRMAMVPGANDASASEEWRSVALATGAPADKQLSAQQIIAQLSLDPDNRSSIRSCFAQARQNGRAVRTALTQDMWEALNDTWRSVEAQSLGSVMTNLPGFLDWTKQRAAAFRGAAETSLLRNDGYDFLRLGEYVERADMILRLLDIKYFVLLPETDVVGGGRDYHQWTSVLRATSAMRAYHHVYRGDYTPWGIAEFLVLNRVFPRSVHFCYRAMARYLEDLAQMYGERNAAHDTTAEMLTRLNQCEIEKLFQSGLHEFVDHALKTTWRVSSEIARAYHF